MSLAYPMNKQTDEELDIIAEVWLESLVRISVDVFQDAMRLHREASNFFPTVNEILECCKSVWEQRRRDVKKIEEAVPDMTPEQTKAAADRVREVMKGVGLPPMRKGKMPVIATGVRTPELVEDVQQRLNRFEEGAGSYSERNN